MLVLQQVFAPPVRADLDRRGVRGRMLFFNRVWHLATSKTMLAIIGQGFASITNFVTGVIVGRVCSKEQYGLYALGFVLTMFFIEIQNAIISTPYTVYAPRMTAAERKGYAGSTLIHQIAWMTAVLFILAAGAAVCSLGFAIEGAAPVAWALAAFAMWVMLRDFVRRICFAEFHMFTALLCDVAVALMQIAGLLILARNNLLSPASAFVVMGIACGAVSLLWLAASRPLFSFNAKQALTDFRRNWTFGKWVCASGVLWSLSMNFYPWILTFFQGAAAAGVFAACAAIVALGTMFVMGVQNFLGPKAAYIYASGGPIALRRFVLLANAAFALPLLGLCAFLGLFGDPFLVLIYGLKYAGNTAVLGVLGLNLLALALGATCSRGLFALERADVDFAVNFVALLVLLTVGIGFVRYYGVLGAAAALLTANTAALIARSGAFWVCVSKKREMPAG